MPFGISVAPEEFECKLQEKLADLPAVVVIRDDILVMGYGDSQEEAVKDHDDNLVRLLQRVREAKMNLTKPDVSFMGNVITSKGLKPDPKKVKVVEEMPRPTSKKELSSLLGIVNYLSKFLPRLAEVAKPL